MYMYMYMYIYIYVYIYIYIHIYIYIYIYIYSFVHKLNYQRRSRNKLFVFLSDQKICAKHNWGFSRQGELHNVQKCDIT